MLTGFVSLDLKPIVRLKIQDVQQQEHEQQVVVDTGFNGSLLLPREFFEQFHSHAQSTAQLADGTEVTFDAFRINLLWNDKWLKVVALATDGDALIGMRLLENHELKIEVRSGGAVQIEPIE